MLHMYDPEHTESWQDYSVSAVNFSMIMGVIYNKQHGPYILKIHSQCHRDCPVILSVMCTWSLQVKTSGLKQVVVVFSLDNNAPRLAVVWPSYNLT